MDAPTRFDNKADWRHVGFVEFEDDGFFSELVNVVHSGIGDFLFEFADCCGDVEACEFFFPHNLHRRSDSILAATNNCFPQKTVGWKYGSRNDYI